MKINFDVPKTWQVKKLEELSHAQKGSIKIGPFGSLLKKAEYSDSGIRVLGIDHVLPNQLTWEKPKYIPEKKYKELAQYSVYPGDILVTNMGTVGRVCVVPDDFPVAIISSHLIKVTPDIKQIDPSYFSWVLNFCPLVVAQIRAKCHGAIMAGFNTTLLKSLEIPLPPIAQQKRIAAILDKADAVRRKRREAIRLTEELLRSTFLEMFGDPQNSIYPVKSLDDVCLKITDGTHFTPNYTSHGIPFLRVTDIQTEKIDWENVKYISQEEHQQLFKRCDPQKGDILYSKNGTIGIPKIVDWDREFSIFVSLALLRPDTKKILSEYLESFLQTPFAIRQALSHTKTGTVSNLHLVEIRKVKLPVPEIALQQRWIDYKLMIYQSRKKLLNAYQESENFFNSLLQRAFTGNL